MIIAVKKQAKDFENLARTQRAHSKQKYNVLSRCNGQTTYIVRTTIR